jgi:hypothetical protein
MIGPVIGLPELPVIDFGGHPRTLKGWKFPAVLDFADGRPLAWLDDDFGSPSFVHAITEFQRRREGVPTLLHHVAPNVGLVDSDIAAVRNWAAELAGQPS